MAIVICEVHIVGHHVHNWLRQLPALIQHALLELILQKRASWWWPALQCEKGCPNLVMHENAVQ